MSAELLALLRELLPLAERAATEEARRNRAPTGQAPTTAAASRLARLRAAIELGDRLHGDPRGAFVQVGDPAFAAHPIAKANAASWPAGPKRRKGHGPITAQEKASIRARKG